MSPIFSIGTIVIAFLLFYICYVIHCRQKKRIVTESFIDDDSYIESIQHLSGKVGIWVWQQYDILLAAQPYGWETMVDLAAYLETADINPIDSLTVSDMPNDEAVELSHVYNQSKVELMNFDKLNEERGVLSIAGHSRTLNNDVKIVWFNQSRGLRLFTRSNDETLVRKYVETLIRRTFGTPDAMKLAQRQR
ncbi:hypothetical protein SAMN05216462_0993 [Xylanibacter ruminicola]|uniref:Uncharacterized protein n=1 Tax=Xylanibacter ruminicola TaxID=839 RepID=A0A1H3ZZP6_XYLRU|nr:hypothetical protein [Xylanibacter ruminicola]SEA29175.1 hypothetical protein SAMN05216462_0993 [Xylanibacter ruminicola]